jgi:gliding motility-associated-like protein
MDPLYRIMLLDADSNYVPIDSVDGFYYEFPVLVCRAELRFRIEMHTDIGCKSISNDYFAVFADTDAPSMPSLDSVSVDPFTGETLLGWSESSEADIGGYVVYHAHVTNDTLAFVYGKQNTSFLDTTANSCLAPKGYAIAAFDTCGNIGPGTYDIPQRTILLNEVVFHPCVMTSSISWTAYINMEPALQGYRLYLSIDSGAFTLLADLPASTLSFEHEDLAAGHHYRYFVRAYSINDAVTSSSCIKEYSTWQYRQPQSNALDIVTVVGSNWVEIGMLPDTFADLQSLKLYRSDLAAGPFNIIEELDPAGEELIFYDDLSAEVNLQSYYYRTTLVDSCGNEVLASQTMRTIFLQGDKLDAQKIALDWNAFEGWPEGVVNYQIYRAIGENGSFQSIAANQPGTLNFEDDISALSGQSNLIRYVIGAVRFGQLDYISYSNEIIFEYEPALYLPNAFSPGGRNPVYKPVGTFAQFNEFRMDIYNRWGELIYTSQDFGEGWDGTHKGKIAPGGVYVCALYYRSNTGQSENMKQSFVLVR